MKHRRSIEFKKLFSLLSPEVQAEAVRRFKVLQDNPAHPQLHFKEFKVGDLKKNQTWSVRAGEKNLRAMGTEVARGVIVWWFIGDHHEYERLMKKSYTPKS